MLEDVNAATEFPKYIANSNMYAVLINIVLSILNNGEIILLDSDLTAAEFDNLQLQKSHLDIKYQIEKNYFHTADELIDALTKTNSWRVTLFTSGTTGTPKTITHSLQSITRHVQISESHCNDVWGFAYNPTHIAGLQVFLQSILNKNTLVYLFKKHIDTIVKLICATNVTHISAAPTFYRQIPKGVSFPNVSRVTSGGEKMDVDTKNGLISLFPNAKYRNVYASTEAGTIFTSKEDIFEIIPSLVNKVKIDNQEILIHKSLIGQAEDINSDWFRTGDIVEIISHNPIRFRIKHRADDLINVGGLQINPHEVEDQIKQMSGVIDVVVYGKSNSIIGNILCADVVGEVTELAILTFLRNRLQRNKIPRIVTVVNEISVGKTGKKKRT